MSLTLSPTLDQLANTIKAELVEAEDHLAETIQNFIRAGDALAEAKAQVPRGGWTVWVEANCGIGAATAHCYMRLAAYRDELPPEARTLTAARVALQGLPALSRENGRGRYSDELREQATLMADEGATGSEIAKALDIAPGTVHSWLNPVAVRANKRKAALRRREAAEQRQERARAAAARRVGGEVEEAYSLLRRAEQKLDTAHSRASDPEVKAALRAALAAAYHCQDDISRALGIKTKPLKKRPGRHLEAAA